MCICLQCRMYACDVHRALSNNHRLSLNSDNYYTDRLIGDTVCMVIKISIQ